MTEPVDKKAADEGGPLFSYGFRPFFLGAALFAGLAVPAWVVMFAGVTEAEAFAAARQWHVHEMVFGFLPAIITGFLLTAIPNWTDRSPVKGRELMLLFALWLAGRFLSAVSSFIPLISATVDSIFLVAVAGIVWREIGAARSWSHAPIAVLISLYACAGIGFHVLSLSDESTKSAERSALGLVMVLLTVIGGRLTPTFTREFILNRHMTREPASFSSFDRLSILLVLFGATGWVLRPDATATGWVLVAAGVINLSRLSRWYGWVTWREPLVLILHVGYAWLAIAMLAVGGAMLGVGLPEPEAVHALTTGAVGAMTLAVMTRASLGHTGRARHAGWITVFIYVLINLGAVMRVFGPTTALPEQAVLVSAVACWSGAYILFASVYGPFLIRPSIEE